MQHAPNASLSLIKFPNANADPERRKDSKDETGDRDETAHVLPSALVCINAKQRPGDGNSAREISFWAGKGVGGGGTLEDHECKKTKILV